MSEFVTFRARRRIGDFTAQVTIEESHADTLTITDHPIEQGAVITDHAFKNPAELTLSVGWSDSSTETGNGYVRAIYAKLLALQASREPFGVTTGKRLYSNMLIRSLNMATDPATEFALFVVLSLRQIIIVQTQTTSVPPREVQAAPEQTEPVTPMGTKQVTPAKKANTSALAEIFG